MLEKPQLSGHLPEEGRKDAMKRGKVSRESSRRTINLLLLVLLLTTNGSLITTSAQYNLSSLDQKGEGGAGEQIQATNEALVDRVSGGENEAYGGLLQDNEASQMSKEEEEGNERRGDNVTLSLPKSDQPSFNVTSTAINIPNATNSSPEQLIDKDASRVETSAKNLRVSSSAVERLETQGDEPPINNRPTFLGEKAEIEAELSKLGNKTFLGGKRESRSVCKISEFNCQRRGKGKCIPSNKYCDGIDDCGNGLDEPRLCTPCNRTYYGDASSTYSLAISSQTMPGAYVPHGNAAGLPTGKNVNLPMNFVCQLTFAAAGEEFGDFVQIMFDNINVGHYTSSTQNGCSEGSIQVAEISRPMTGGHWCGSGAGYAVYFSEMSALTLTLAVGSLQFNKGEEKVSGGKKQAREREKSGEGSSSEGMHKSIKGDTTLVISSTKQPLDFELKFRYKFIPRAHAFVRYGLLGNNFERGELVPGTYCSRVLDSCHVKKCKIQSPNYPGLYPRNVTCHFTIRQRPYVPCKRSLIKIAQMKPHKVQLRSSPGSRKNPEPGFESHSIPSEHSANVENFLAWEECDEERDSITIYDGTRTSDPVLLKICGGAFIPPVSSSGPDILVVFKSTPFGNLLEPKPPAPFPLPLRGFELDVKTEIVDSESADYILQNNCTFLFVSSKDEESSQKSDLGGNWITGKSGLISNPKHTLGRNTTCKYEFRGKRHEAIWIYFISYKRELIKDSKDFKGNCTTRLRILDGISARNEVLLGSFCDNELPRLCDHKALQNQTRLVRACESSESYISAGSRLIIEQRFLEGNALRPLHYHLHYEFVNRHVGSMEGCNRHFHSKNMPQKGFIRTSDNIFDFGRGGRQNITCIYTFYLQSFESLRLTVANSSFGDRGCHSGVDSESGRYACKYFFPNETYYGFEGSMSSHQQERHAKSQILLYEYIWPSKNISSHEQCLCGNSSNGAYSFTFLGRKVQMKFQVENMVAEDSYDNFFVNFDYEITRRAGCRGDNHYMRTESGMILLESSFVHGPKDLIPSCEHYPWFLEAKTNHSLYIRIPGFPMLEDRRIQYIDPKRNTSRSPNLAPSPLDVVDGDGESSNKREKSCHTTKNRILVYDGKNNLIQKVCPSSNLQLSKKKIAKSVEIYSDDFYTFHSPLFPPSPSTFVVEFVRRELGQYRIQWLEIISAKTKLALEGKEVSKNGTEKKPLWEQEPFTILEHEERLEPEEAGKDSVHLVAPQKGEASQLCSSYCPELNACISPKLWCDSIPHCPISEVDELACDTFLLTMNQLMNPVVYIPIATGVVSALCCCLIVFICLMGKRKCIRARAKSLSRATSRAGSRCSTIDSRGSRHFRGGRETLPPRDFYHGQGQGLYIDS